MEPVAGANGAGFLSWKQQMHQNKCKSHSQGFGTTLQAPDRTHVYPSHVLRLTPRGAGVSGLQRRARRDTCKEAGLVPPRAGRLGE